MNPDLRDITDPSQLDNEMRTLTISSTSDQISPYQFDADKWSRILNPPVTDDPVLLQRFQIERLKMVLKHQEEERNDASFSRECLFCRKHFMGNRSLLFEHLTKDHNFHVGAPDNIVFGNNLLDVLAEKLKNLQCFYCEKTFKDLMVLKEHMRKKQHKRINPKNKTYDKFYLINYLELGKSWTDVQNEDDTGFEHDEDEGLNDEEMECQDEVVEYLCLFCDVRELSLDQVLAHMKDEHKFDYESLKDKHCLDFYKQVKLINYIRRQVSLKICIFCDQDFSHQSDLVKHMKETGHSSLLPDENKWNQAMFYFPTYEDDSFLCALEDASEDSAHSFEEPVIVPEELNVNLTSGMAIEEMRKTLLGQEMT